MKVFIQILVNHKWAIFLAILVGIIIASPQVYFSFKHNDIYQGIGLTGPDEEFYLARIQEIRDGHFALANPFWAEGKDLPYTSPPLSEIIVSFTGKIFGLNLINTVVLSKFIFPVFIYLFIYIFLYQLIRKKSVAIAISTTVLFSTNLINPNAFWNFIVNQQTTHSFLAFGRLISPQVHLIFFFGFLLLFWFFLDKKKWIYGLASGFVLGLSFYTFPYTWTFLCSFLGCLLFIFIWKKEWIKFKNIILVSVIALIVAVPYLLNSWQAVQHPVYSEIAIRYGLIKTHMPQAGAVVLVLLIVFLLFFPREKPGRYHFCLALVLTPLIVLNQQIITGSAIAPDHYHWYYHSPLAIIFILIIIFQQLEQRIKKSSLKKICYLSLIGFVLITNFYYALLVQVSSYKGKEQITIENQRYGSVFEWFNNYSYKDEVVMANSEISVLIPIYTSLNPLTTGAGYAHYFIVADEEQLSQRLFLKLRLDQLNTDEAVEYFFEKRADVSGELYGQQYRKRAGDYGQIPDKKLYWLAEEYKKSLNIPLKDALQKYQAKYLIWDTQTDPDWLIDQYSFLKQIYQVEGIGIYQLLYD